MGPPTPQTRSDHGAPAVRCGARIQCLCGAFVDAQADERLPLDGDVPRHVMRYQGWCLCGLAYFLSVASTHGSTITPRAASGRPAPAPGLQA